MLAIRKSRMASDDVERLLANRNLPLLPAEKSSSFVSLATRISQKRPVRVQNESRQWQLQQLIFIQKQQLYGIRSLGALHLDNASRAVPARTL